MKQNFDYLKQKALRKGLKVIHLNGGFQIREKGSLNILTGENFELTECEAMDFINNYEHSSNTFNYNDHYGLVGCKNLFGSLSARKDEIWRPCVENEKYKFSQPYWISNYGTLYSSVEGKVIIPRDNGDGYFRFRLTNDSKLQEILVHQLVACYYLPNPKGYPTVDHLDGNKRNNHVSNLEWCSFRENTNRCTELRRIKKLEPHERFYATYENTSDILVFSDETDRNDFVENEQIVHPECKAVQYSEIQGADNRYLKFDSGFGCFIFDKMQ